MYREANCFERNKDVHEPNRLGEKQLLEIYKLE